MLWQPVGLGKIAKLINAGEIDSSELITMKILKVMLLIGYWSTLPLHHLIGLVKLLHSWPISMTGYRSHREADRRWSKVNGSWLWTDPMAYSSWGMSEKNCKRFFLKIKLHIHSNLSSFEWKSHHYSNVAAMRTEMPLLLFQCCCNCHVMTILFLSFLSNEVFFHHLGHLDYGCSTILLPNVY